MSVVKDRAALHLQTMAHQSAQLEMLNATVGFSTVSRFALTQADWGKLQAWRISFGSETCSVGSTHFESLTFLS
jgi:hypothetical protein